MLLNMFVFSLVLQNPLNSDDDISDDDPTELFDTENIIVCQYDKVGVKHCKT